MPATCTNVTVTTSATKIISANSARQELIFTNNSITDMYIGPNSSVTAITGLPLYGNQTRERSRGFSIWLGDIYGITSSGTCDVRVWETTR